MPLSLDIGPRINKVAISDELIARFKELIERKVFVPGQQTAAGTRPGGGTCGEPSDPAPGLRALQIMGVIKARQGSGSYLADSASDIMRVPLEFALALKNVAKTDLFETRRTLEVELASLAAQRRTNDDLRGDAPRARRDGEGHGRSRSVVPDRTSSSTLASCRRHAMES